jgi:hypothetical protein
MRHDLVQPVSLTQIRAEFMPHIQVVDIYGVYGIELAALTDWRAPHGSRTVLWQATTW